jgi:hypothetical protein
MRGGHCSPKRCGSCPETRIAVEAPDVLGYDELPQPPHVALHSVLALDGKPLAWTRGPGQAMAWFA